MLVKILKECCHKVITWVSPTKWTNAGIIETRSIWHLASGDQRTIWSRLWFCGCRHFVRDKRWCRAQDQRSDAIKPFLGTGPQGQTHKGSTWASHVGPSFILLLTMGAHRKPCWVAALPYSLSRQVKNAKLNPTLRVKSTHTRTHSFIPSASTYGDFSVLVTIWTVCLWWSQPSKETSEIRVSMTEYKCDQH